MPVVNNSNVFYHQGLVFRSNLTPDRPVNKLCLLLHGWDGDENSMQIFFSDFPEDVGLIAPRAPHKTKEKGYTWAYSLTDWSIIQSTPHSHHEELIESAGNLVGAVDIWARFFGIAPDKIYAAGFSQGGAMSLILGLLYPGIFKRVACLSGFLPEGIESDLPAHSENLPAVLMTHGTLDEIIQIEKARETFRRLQNLGMDVDFCEDRIGHKIGVECRKKLGAFFIQND